jgi:hypothetical protein
MVSPADELTEAEEAFQEAYDGLFSKIAPAEATGAPDWRPVLSPLFPTRWPATRGTSLLRYAYAQGYKSAFGTYIAAPWAIVTVSFDGQDLELMPVGPFVDLGRGDGGYGFKVGQPVENGYQPAPSELEDESRSLVMAGLPEKPPTHIRVAYQQWAVGHSISRFLEPLQPGFFAWLDAR